MKKTFKHYLKLGILLFGISLTLLNCQKDDDSSYFPINGQGNKIIKVLRKNDIIKNSKVYSSINKTNGKLKRGSLNKVVSDSKTNIEIDTDYAKYLEKDNGYHSYTFLVINTPEGGGLENVLLSLQNDGNYKEILIHYNISDEEISMLNNGEFVNFEGRITSSVINSNFSYEALSKVFWNDGCMYETTGDPERFCCQGVHAYSLGNASQCTLAPYCKPFASTLSTSILYCNPTGGDNSNTDGEQTGDGTVNGSGDPSSDENDESAVVSCSRNCIEDIEVLPPTNCDELKKLTEVPTYTIAPPLLSPKSALESLELKLDKEDEHGFSFKHNSEFNAFANKVDLVGSSIINYPPHANIFGGVHTHPNDGVVIPMFSHADIKCLLDFSKNYNSGTESPSSLFVHVLVSSHGTYALKIKNIENLNNLTEIYNDVRKKRIFERNLDRKLGKFYDKNTAQLTGSPNDYQKAFLKFINNFDNEGSSLGVSLYKLDNSLSNWEEITLDSNEADGTKEIPCN